MDTIVRFMFIVVCFAAIGLPVEAQAPAPVPEVLVFGISSIEGDDSLARDATIALRAILGSMEGYQLNPAEVDRSQIELAAGCETLDSGCFDTIVSEARYAGVDLFIYGNMTRAGEGTSLRMRVELSLYDVAARAVIQQYTVEVTVEELMSPELRRELGQVWLAELMDASVPISTGPAPPLGSVAMSHADFEILGWTLAGTSVVLAAIAIGTGSALLSMNGDARFQGYRESWSAASGNVCDLARGDPSPEGRYAASHCDSATSLEIATPILWGVASGLLFGGILAIWHPTVGEERRSDVSLTPSLGPGHAGLSLSGNF